MLRPLLVPVLLFVLACCYPALEWTKDFRPNDIMFGMRAFAVGWSGILAGVFAWYANPLWLLAAILIFIRRPLWALAPSILAIVIGFTMYSDLGRELPGDEGGTTKTTIIKLLPGCYIWLASLIAMPLAAIAEKLFRKKPAQLASQQQPIQAQYPPQYPPQFPQ